MTDAERYRAVALAAKLRSGGEAVMLSLRAQKPKKFFSRAGASAAKAVYIGPDDVSRGYAKIKDMETAGESEIKL